MPVTHGVKRRLSPQYTRVHETRTPSETELQDAVTALRDFLETSTAKLTAPVQVSLPDVRTFVRSVQVQMKSPGWNNLYDVVYLQRCIIIKYLM